MKKSELRKLIQQTYREVLLQAKEDQIKQQQTEDISDAMLDDPNVRYTMTDSTLICIGTHPNFGPMPIFNQTIKVDRDIKKAGLDK